MTVLSAQTIRKLNLLSPMEPAGMDSKGRSYGLSACGYDLRIDQDVQLTEGCFVLAGTVERFNLPTDVVGIIHDKSSLARLGIAVQNTVAEPGWCGWLTLEISNNHVRTVPLNKGDAIAQVIFHFLDEPTELPYVGRYQNQERGPQGAR
jgi:dCTP deaminase